LAATIQARKEEAKKKSQDEENKQFLDPNTSGNRVRTISQENSASSIQDRINARKEAARRVAATEIEKNGDKPEVEKPVPENRTTRALSNSSNNSSDSEMSTADRVRAKIEARKLAKLKEEQEKK